MSKTLISVTQEHIDKGSAFNPTSCPVSLAVNSRLPKNYRAITGGDGIILNRNILGVWVPVYERDLRISRRLSQWISRFDLNKKVEPINFWININVTKL